MEPSEYKKFKSQEREGEWRQKVMHGPFASDNGGVNWDKSCKWIAKGYLKGCTEDRDQICCCCCARTLKSNRKLKRLNVWQMDRVAVVPVVIGASSFSSCFGQIKKRMEKLHVKIAKEVIQKTALLGTASILRKVLSL